MLFFIFILYCFYFFGEVKVGKAWLMLLECAVVGKSLSSRMAIGHLPEKVVFVSCDNWCLLEYV